MVDNSNNMCIPNECIKAKLLPSASLLDNKSRNNCRKAGSVIEEAAVRSSPDDKEVSHVLAAMVISVLVSGTREIEARRIFTPGN